jgi:hypothetical protein
VADVRWRCSGLKGGPYRGTLDHAMTPSNSPILLPGSMVPTQRRGQPMNNQSLTDQCC